MKICYRWRNPRLPHPNRTLLARLAKAAAAAAGLPAEGDWVLELNFTGDGPMTVFNRDIVGHQGTTDVITVSYFDDPENVFPGDTAIELFINADYAAREGAARPTGYAYEMALYLAHGLLHASGEDDLTPGPRRRMRRREREVLTSLSDSGFDFASVFPEKKI